MRLSPGSGDLAHKFYTRTEVFGCGKHTSLFSKIINPKFEKIYSSASQILQLLDKTITNQFQNNNNNQRVQPTKFKEV